MANNKIVNILLIILLIAFIAHILLESILTAVALYQYFQIQ